MLARMFREEWPKEWLQKGREEGRVEGRAEGGVDGRPGLLRRQTRQKVREDTAMELSKVTERLTAAERLDEIGDLFVTCTSGGEFLQRVRELVEHPSTDE